MIKDGADGAENQIFFEEEKHMEGSKLLKVSGILMIIGGSISLIIAIIAMIGIAVLAAMGGSAALLWLSGIMLLVGAVVEFVGGIIGVKNWNNLEKAQTCMVWGILAIALCVLSQILNLAGGGSFNVVSLATGLVLPVLYLIGALQNKKKTA